MAVATSSRKYTYEDYLLLPDDEGQLYEIIDGELFVNASPIPRHQRVSGKLFFFLYGYVSAHDCGELYFAPLDVVLSQRDVFQPDLLYITKENARILAEKNVQGTPDFVVEILSESNRRKDEVLKLQRYDLFGVAEYWIVDLESDRVTVYRRTDEHLQQVEIVQRDGTLTNPFFPGLAIDAAAVFA